MNCLIVFSIASVCSGLKITGLLSFVISFAFVSIIIIHDIFPNVNKIEFETDSRVLERFQTEQALSTNGITMIPAVWTDGTGSCFPGIQINMMNGSIAIPFEDVISIGQMLKTFEPNQFGLSILRIIGKID